MKTILVVMTVLGFTAVVHSAGTETATPDVVFASFVLQVSALSTNHPELADFPDYAERRDSRLDVSFHRNPNPVTTMRRIAPSDFGKNGILLQFVLDDGSNPRHATSDTVTYFPNLKRTLYADLVLWEGASLDLRRALEDIIAKHKALLDELDKKAANNGVHGNLAPPRGSEP